MFEQYFIERKEFDALNEKLKSLEESHNKLYRGCVEDGGLPMGILEYWKRGRGIKIFPSERIDDLNNKLSMLMDYLGVEVKKQEEKEYIRKIAKIVNKKKKGMAF